MDWLNKVKALQEAHHSLRVEKDGQLIFESTAVMLKPLYACSKKMPEQMRGSTVVDKIVGKAAAYICIVAGVKQVFTPIASQSAAEVLKEHDILLMAQRIIPQIKNRDNSGQCPMEILADSAGSPEAFYRQLENRIAIE